MQILTSPSQTHTHQNGRRNSWKVFTLCLWARCHQERVWCTSCLGASCVLSQRSHSYLWTKIFLEYSWIYKDWETINNQPPEKSVWFPNLLVSRKADVGGVRSQRVGKWTNFDLPGICCVGLPQNFHIFVWFGKTFMGLLHSVQICWKMYNLLLDLGFFNSLPH